MRVISLKSNPQTYSCKAYLVIGDWNRLEDVNTLVDVGSDGFVIDEIESLSTGFGKRPVEQVVLTHGHCDHVSGLSAIREKYNPTVYAFTRIDGVDELIGEGDALKMGDREFSVIHAPGHSNDSICLYCPREKALFSGDSTLKILSPGGSYEPAFITFLERLAGMDIEVVFSGHDAPVTRNAGMMIRTTLANVNETIRPSRGDSVERG